MCYLIVLVIYMNVRNLNTMIQINTRHITTKVYKTTYKYTLKANYGRSGYSDTSYGQIRLTDK
ncbi:hypothetical protein HanIR_Chr17g0880781 [Helianthus annuus]|nr:hypothetical protein HanIR_Chr17g0880781 [Helianthus annuus]